MQISILTFISSPIHDKYILNMAPGEGGPIYCLISALSTKARSIAPVTLEVVRIITLLYLKKIGIKI